MRLLLRPRGTRRTGTSYAYDFYETKTARFTRRSRSTRDDCGHPRPDREMHMTDIHITITIIIITTTNISAIDGKMRGTAHPSAVDTYRVEIINSFLQTGEKKHKMKNDDNLVEKKKKCSTIRFCSCDDCV